VNDGRMIVLLNRISPSAQRSGLLKGTCLIPVYSFAGSVEAWVAEKGVDSESEPLNI
jgi:hypothetical protein